MDDKLSPAPLPGSELERYIREWQTKSFLEKNDAVMREQNERIARADKILGSYANAQNFSNTLQNLLPSPVPKMQARIPAKPVQTQNFNPGSLAVVPPALKFLRKLATRNRKENTPNSDPIFEFPQVGKFDGSFIFPQSFTTKKSKNNVFETDRLLTKEGKPIALLSLRPETHRDYDKYKLGDAFVSSDQFRNLVSELEQMYQKRNEERILKTIQNKMKDPFAENELPEYINYTSLYRNIKNPVYTKVKLDVNYPYGSSTIAEPDNNYDRMYNFNTRGFEVDPKSIIRDPLKMGNYRYNSKTQNPGALSVKQMLPVIKSLFPDATTVEGYRISGAKAKNDKFDKKQTIKLPNLTEARMLKELGLYKKPLHHSIQNRKPGDVKNYITRAPNKKPPIPLSSNSDAELNATLVDPELELLIGRLFGGNQ